MESMTFEQFQEKFKPNTQRLTAQKELDVWNIKQEYKAIHNFYIDRGKIFKNKYEEARYKILKWIITCATNDTEEGDLISEKNDEMLKDAGKLLYEFDGMKGMHDNLVWDFVPTRYRRNNDCVWDGIGEWSS
jgi:hypothetical protein